MAGGSVPAILGSQQCGAEKLLKPVKGDHPDPVVKVDMPRAGNHHQFAVAGDLAVHCLAEIQAMRLIARDQQDTARRDIGFGGDQ